MSGNFIVNTPKSAMHALAYQGIMVSDSFSQIRDMLRNRRDFGDEYVLLFAEPVPNAADSSIDWYTPVQGEVQRLTDLPEEEQNRLRDKLARMAGEIRRYADELKQSPGPSGLTRGNILALSLSYPGEETLFVVGGQPVFTCWGYGPGTPGAEPQDLSRLARLAPSRPAPTPVAAVVPAPAEDELLAVVPEEEPAPVPPVAPVPAKGGGAGCLLWLLPLLLLLLLLLLFFIGIGGLPAISGYTLYNIPWKAAEPPELALVREQNAELERELATLAEQARAHAEQCREGEPLVIPELPPEQPGEELVIPDEPPQEGGRLAFLQGRWRCETGLVSGDTGEPVVVEFVFDDEGRGRAIVQEKNDRCVGEATARLDEGELHIDIEEQRCGRGDSYSGQRIDCRNKGAAAECKGTNQSRTGEAWEAQFFRLTE